MTRIVRDELGEIRVRDDPEYGWSFFWDIYEHHGWEDWLREPLRELLRPGDVFVDVGAWIGPVSLWAARCGATVIALEPDPVACAALLDHVAWNEVDVTVVAAAAGTSPGLARLARSPVYGDSNSRLATEGDMLVAAVDVPRLIEGLGFSPSQVRAVKVDVEGYEYALMPALEPWLRAHGIVEFVSWHEKESG